MWRFYLTVSRWVLRVASIVFLLSVIDANAEDPPNILLIVSDDQAWTDFGFMGHEVIETPHLDKLASQSATFINGYVPTSLCRASLATILTGQYAHQHKICNNDPPEGVDREKMLPFLQNTETLPRLLQQKGYKSFQTGKFWEGHYSNGGFTHGMTTKGRHGEEGLTIGREGLQPIYNFIEKDRGDSPFFVWYAPFLPHNPHNPPEKYLKKYAVEGRNLKLAKYWAMCEWFDNTCGELLDYLDENNLSENTIVAFVVDNGWIQETGDTKTTRGWFAPKSKLSPYDGGLRTPIMIKWPGRIQPKQYKDLVSSIDLMPTLLSAVGMEAPANRPGINLLSKVQEEKPIERDTLYGELFYHDGRNLQDPASSLTHLWMRQGDWKIIESVGEIPSYELYDLASDPHEEKDLSTTNPEKVAAMSQKLSQWSDWQ